MLSDDGQKGETLLSSTHPHENSQKTHFEVYMKFLNFKHEILEMMISAKDPLQILESKIFEKYQKIFVSLMPLTQQQQERAIELSKTVEEGLKQCASAAPTTQTFQQGNHQIISNGGFISESLFEIFKQQIKTNHDRQFKKYEEIVEELGKQISNNSQNRTAICPQCYRLKKLQRIRALFASNQSIQTQESALEDFFILHQGEEQVLNDLSFQSQDLAEKELTLMIREKQFNRKVEDLEKENQLIRNRLQESEKELWQQEQAMVELMQQKLREIEKSQKEQSKAQQYKSLRDRLQLENLKRKALLHAEREDLNVMIQKENFSHFSNGLSHQAIDSQKEVSLPSMVKQRKMKAKNLREEHEAEISLLKTSI